MVWFTINCCTKRNPFIYIIIPFKEGDVSVIKRNAWNCYLKKYSISYRKYSIILKGYFSISCYFFKNHNITCLYTSFLEKNTIYNIYVFFLKKGGIPCSKKNYTNKATTSKKSKIKPYYSKNIEKLFSS